MHEITGRKPPLSLLVLGDSFRRLGRHRPFRGWSGGATGHVDLRADRASRALARRRIQLGDVGPDPRSRPAQPFGRCRTHIVLCIGTNDTKNFHSVARFKKEFGGLLYALRAKWPEARVVWSPVLEFTRAPAMPSLLGKILEIRAREMNRMGTRLCYERGAVPASRLPITNPEAGFASDGFHASAAGYRASAEHLLRFVVGDDEGAWRHL
ncbi:SGNH/GDSL hydrolase family protein [Mesorhizobium sp. UC22_110]|uniref:SGNH/GDSL hydrolase family protein n=1 Tax=Mesorhizobium sp. UC22_110 TaxID=3374552 RepID=UPI0037579B56